MPTPLVTWLPIATRDEVAGRRHRQIEPLEAIVWHYTTGPGSPIPWLHQREDSVCWHFTITRDGKITQHIPLDARTWHAGGSVLDGRKNVNGRTIGVECANMGPVDLLKGDSLHPILAARSKRFTAAEIKAAGLRFGRIVSGNTWLMRGDLFIDADGSLWEGLSGPQIESIMLLGIDLAKWSIDYADAAFCYEKNHVGHGEIYPKKAPEPGPCFPWQALRDNLRHVRLTHVDKGSPNA